jgi:uncharacterized protein (DUF697 family)/GTP-binding protein EngB required for normal cell division
MARDQDRGKIDRFLGEARGRITELATDAARAAERLVAERSEGRDAPEQAIDPGARERDPMEVFSVDRQREIERLGHANILVVGQTGVGKSTLINAIFRKPLAAESTGRPVTKVIQRFEDPDVPVTLYDTRGVELGDQKKAVIRDFRSIIEKSHKGPPEDHIHLVWYCIDSGQTRVQTYDDEIIHALAEEIPVVLVFTQTIDDERADALEQTVTDAELPIVGHAVRTLATKRRIGRHTLQPRGLEELTRLTHDLLPEGVRRAFANAQGVLLDLKATHARAVVAAAAAAAAGVGAAPIKGPDALVLRPIQLAMLSGITAVFGVDFETETLKRLLSAATGQGGVEKIGKQAVKLALKHAPGFGAAVNATIAAALTAALGEAYVRVCTEYLRRGARGKPMPADDVASFLLRAYRAILKARPIEMPVPEEETETGDAAAAIR